MHEAEFQFSVFQVTRQSLTQERFSVQIRFLAQGIPGHAAEGGRTHILRVLLVAAAADGRRTQQPAASVRKRLSSLEGKAMSAAGSTSSPSAQRLTTRVASRNRESWYQFFRSFRRENKNDAEYSIRVIDSFLIYSTCQKLCPLCA